MLSGYVHEKGGLRRLAPDEPLHSALWLDLADPDEDERARAAAVLGAPVPGRAEMEEIEISSRLYQDAQAAYLTIVLPALSETAEPIIGPVAFVLTRDRLVSTRHIAPRPFETYPGRAGGTGFGCASADSVLMGLMAEFIDRLADILERIGGDLEGVSKRVFRRQGGRRSSEELRGLLEDIGRKGDLLGEIGASLLSIERALGFFGQILEERSENKGLRRALETQLSDVKSLSEHSAFLNEKVSLMLDATLGMINIAQNDTIKIFSVLAVVFMPPTLIASIYGMNFRWMPELHTVWGYPFALLLMLGSAVGTYRFFKRRGWL